MDQIIYIKIVRQIFIENYGENINVKLDLFFDEKIAVNEDEVESTLLEEYKLCSKCGSIYPKNNLNALKCDCDEELKISVYRVQNSKSNGDFIVYNNINTCPCCGHKSNSGIIKNLNLGKDEGTALVAQILYEAIDEEKEYHQSGQVSLSLTSRFSRTTEEKKVKQFLCFSDSRQQAVLLQRF